MMNFVVRKCYEPLNTICQSVLSKKACIIGIPGIAKSVFLCYPLLKHFIPYIESENFENALPVVLHHPDSDGAFIWHQNSSWEVKDFMQHLNDLKNCVDNFPGLLNLVDGAPHGAKWLKYPSGPLVIQTTSADGNYKGPYKHATKKIMPCWIFGELSDRIKRIGKNVGEETLQERYHK